MNVFTIIVLIAQISMFGVVCKLFKQELIDECKAVLARIKRWC